MFVVKHPRIGHVDTYFVSFHVQGIALNVSGSKNYSDFKIFQNILNVTHTVYLPQSNFNILFIMSACMYDLYVHIRLSTSLFLFCTRLTTQKCL